MKKAVIICLFFLFCGKSANCATTYFPPLQPLRGMNEVPNYSSNSTASSDPFATPPALNYPDITKIERSLFGRTFANQNMSNRLSRIEKSLFSKTFSNSSEIQRIDNIISNFNQINKYPNISQNALSKIESQIFNQNFAQNSAKRRIERLEEQLFGAVQSGDMKSRYEAILLAAKASRQNNNYYPNTRNNSIKGLAANIGSALLGGSMTGFTPQINPFYNNYSSYNGYVNPNRFNYSNPFMRTYANPYTMPYSNPYTTSAYPSNYGMSQGISTRGPGYSYYNGTSNVGTGIGVTILD